ncbi:TPA: hypothetical protein N0F65_004332 [Lagenidium giganteum]|uniref:Transmembrane protein n=1 Tax=Lagenidium giganteum TaxID=4803 RepID=A0AAV2YJ21_9STRA|nr:TPA: hypothetical protein N0F65_004332 [Lagenidium giganteum]
MTTATCVARSTRRQRWRRALPLIADLLLMAVLVLMDVQDLYYKLVWIGPHETFAFYATSKRVMQSKPLVLTKNLLTTTKNEKPRLNASSLHASGWPALLANCDELYAAGPAAPLPFIGAVGINCTIGARNRATTVKRFYMSGSARADAMAWAACKLLRIQRRPVLCRSSIVTGFLHRYGLPDATVPVNNTALPESDAEAELLALLHVITISMPVDRIVCVEGFALGGPGQHVPSLFGCGSPNTYESAFVGIHASGFAELHRNKAWITIDTLHLVGLSYRLRQNCYSEFSAAHEPTNNTWTISHKTVANFSSSGTLYNLMIVLDVVLTLTHLVSAVELATAVVVPLLAAQFEVANSKPGCSLHSTDYATPCSSSLCRSTIFVVLSVVTQLLSWLIILPNAIIWTWSKSVGGKVQAYLSSLRLWILIVLVLNLVWDCVVGIDEALAYRVTSLTFISSIELLAIMATVAYWQRNTLFAIGSTKYAVERQRLSDSSSFVNFKALANTYNAQLDSIASTPTDILWIIYGPLVAIVWRCLMVTCCWLIVKPVIWRCCVSRPQRHVPASTAAIVPQYAAVSVQERSSTSSGCARRYQRLREEHLLGQAVRARSLVRSRWGMDHAVVDPDTQVLGRRIFHSHLLEYGALVENGRLRTRVGFVFSVSPLISADGFTRPKASSPTTRSCDSAEKRSRGDPTA